MGLHYVGDWHTHPELKPTPASLDISSMKDCFIKSIHELNYFVLTIVGTSPKKANIWVGLINDKKVINL